MSGKFELEKSKGQIRQILCRVCNTSTNHEVLASVNYNWDEEWIQGYSIVLLNGLEPKK